MSEDTSIVLFRNDLRLSDNPALHEACRASGPVVPVFLWSPEEDGTGKPGAASRFWLHQSLQHLQESLRRRGNSLCILRGPLLRALTGIIRDVNARRVYWNRVYLPGVLERDALMASELETIGCEVRTFNASLLVEPDAVSTRSGAHFKVFTPFWRACQQLPLGGEPLPAPARIPAPAVAPDSLDLQALNLEPSIDWAGGIRESWAFGEGGAHACLNSFLEHGLADYQHNRDLLAEPGTSRLSPYLHFGEISPRQVLCEVQSREAASPGMAESLVRQLFWREFASYLLFHEPQTPREPLYPRFAAFPWHHRPEMLARWQQGLTGYPVVDAGMRQLWQTGWMHNRARMIVGSFLTKHLLIDWREGAAWFWDTLVDADLANNTFGWQWIAGCGADAAPYFRIFNPVKQGEKFDPEGHYVRQWVPELAALPDKFIHRPWEAPLSVLEERGVRLGSSYPQPIVDHQAARTRALEAYQTLRALGGPEP